MAELNDFLPASQRGGVLWCSFNGNQSVKHLIESLGAPHTEVKQIRIEDRCVDFDYIVQHGDHIDVYPISKLERAQQKLAHPTFVLDIHLGQLAAYLRLLGFDTLYRNDFNDVELAKISSGEARILLTRDRRLLMRNLVQQGYWIRSKLPREQITEVLWRYNLYAEITPFRLCIRCNGVLQEVSKAAVLDRLQPLTRKYFNDYRICPDCDQIYWKGSHYDHLMNFIEQVRREEKPR